MKTRVALLLFLSSLAAPAAAGNPDGPVGSLGIGFDYTTLISSRATGSGWQAEDARNVGLLLNVTIPMADYVTGAFGMQRWGSEFDDPTFYREAMFTDVYFSAGIRIYLPFTSAAQEVLAQ